MLRLLRYPGLWVTGLLVWYGALWVLSSIPGNPAPPPIPEFDKFEHFSYFFGGGLLAAGWLRSRRPDAPQWRNILLGAIILMAVLGFIDEWHQCYTPKRSGADPWDWLADVVGATSGAFALKALWRRFL